jgi:hypothetical protein
MSYYALEVIGPKRRLTPEKFLLCEDVPVARTGQMLYGPGEVPVDPGPDGTIIVDRFPEDVFHPDTIASFQGKDVVDEHPDRDVATHNWRDLTVGVALNVRRGEGVNDDVLLADLLIKDPSAIDAIQSGKREVSCGYQARYVDSTAYLGHAIPGRAKQTNIIGNHIALVHAGRCGSRCSIGDSKPKLTEDCAMNWMERLKAAWAGKDEAAFNAALAEAPKEGPISLTKDQLKTIATMVRDEKHGDDCDCKMCKGSSKDSTMDSRMKRVEDAVDTIAKDVKAMKDEAEEKKKREEEEEEETHDNEKILGELEEEAPPGTGDAAWAATKDSARLEDSFQETVALAEVIAPGVQFPTFDAKAAPAKTLDAVCKFRRTVMSLAQAKPEYRVFVDGVLKGRTVDALSCGATRVAFRALGEFAKDANNRSSAAATAARTNDGPARPKKMTIADIQKMNEEMYAGSASKQ